ncbi:acyl carrier protein phosphodiesterase [Winogradskyella wandonensis]|uniref:Acyl carrier protein phosphodiesterase n=1 Tax=Winogradskyella wandonensis TaxID=1442586 RepID=A0A4R1KVH0_9FLAO|nr:acyl carrier protein phosphodiesterase [Winogradskyella wandonensis]TCK69144.1 acyl carrier protein phosphodiesterase [Winogradskyella wandonensis]
MNFLAHIYLSGENELLTIGNFAADGIRGRRYKDYPKAMQVGILLHRFIDSYTDAHPNFRDSTRRLHKAYGHYSGVIVDIFYDHFLAKNWSDYNEQSLDAYIQNFYNSLKRHFEILPERFKKLVPFMINDNWLLSYATIEGIQKVLDGMNRRTKGRSNMNEATKELVEFYDAFENDFKLFFEELKQETETKRIALEKEYSL